MDFIKDDIHLLYRTYLFPSLASAVVMSIYAFVDAIAVGQSEGALGAAAMAVVAPIFGVIVFFSVLCGVGGSVLMGVARGEGKPEKGNACFTASVLLMAGLTAAIWLMLALFHRPIFTLFGANAEVLPKLMEYARWIIWGLPLFVFPIYMGFFVRSDGNPNLAMAAVIIGGCFNMFGDWFFVFPLGLGMSGAGMATAMGTAIQSIIMAIHLFQKRCRLRLVRPRHLGKGLRRILQIGFGASVLDLGSVIIGVLINNQILRYSGTTALAVYGAIATIMALFQALFGGVGQAIQPLVSANFGARQPARIRAVWRSSLVTVLALGVVFTLLVELFPLAITRLFIAATPAELAAAPRIFRLYFPMFLVLCVVVLAAYYLQSILEDRMSMAVGLMHSLVVSGALLLLLPLALGADGVWLALPCADLIVAAIAALYIVRRANPRLG